MNALQQPILPEEQKKKDKTEAGQEPPHKPLPWSRNLDFWRFVLAALSLAWEIAKTWVR